MTQALFCVLVAKVETDNVRSNTCLCSKRCRLSMQSMRQQQHCWKASVHVWHLSKGVFSQPHQVEQQAAGQHMWYPYDIRRQVNGVHNTDDSFRSGFGRLLIHLPTNQSFFAADPVLKQCSNFSTLFPMGNSWNLFAQSCCKVIPRPSTLRSVRDDYVTGCISSMPLCALQRMHCGCFPRVTAHTRLPRGLQQSIKGCTSGPARLRNAGCSLNAS